MRLIQSQRSRLVKGVFVLASLALFFLIAWLFKDWILGLRMGWKLSDGPFRVNGVSGEEVLDGGRKGVLGFRYDGSWYSTKSYFEDDGVISPHVYKNRSSKMPSIVVHGYYAGFVERAYPIQGKDGNSMGKCLLAFRMLYLENSSEKKMNIVNVCILSKLENGEKVVHLAYWDLLDWAGYYEEEKLRSFFKPITENFLGQASFRKNSVDVELAGDYSEMDSYFDPNLDTLLESREIGQNQYYAFKLSMEFAASQVGGLIRLLEGGNFSRDEVLVPFQFSIPIK